MSKCTCKEGSDGEFKLLTKQKGQNGRAHSADSRCSGLRFFHRFPGALAAAEAE